MVLGQGAPCLEFQNMLDVFEGLGAFPKTRSFKKLIFIAGSFEQAKKDIYKLRNPVEEIYILTTKKIGRKYEENIKLKMSERFELVPKSMHSSSMIIIFSLFHARS